MLVPQGDGVQAVVVAARSSGGSVERERPQGEHHVHDGLAAQSEGENKLAEGVEGAVDQRHVLTDALPVWECQQNHIFKKLRSNLQ